MAEILADDIAIDDRRRVVNAGIRHGRDAEIENMRAVAELGVTNITSDVIATRGERLVLLRILCSGATSGPRLPRRGARRRRDRHRRPDRGNRHVRPRRHRRRLRGARCPILAGEAAAHAHTWSVIAEAYAAFNRHELPATTPDWVNVDHRRGTAFAAGELTAYVRSVWDVTPDVTIYIEAVHRLSSLGAVFTHMANGTSPEGFDAEWREIDILTVEGDLISHCEMFDEADIDAALASFEELSRPAPRLENAASRGTSASGAYFAARDWDAMAEILADDISTDDRRRVVGAGVRHGRDAEIENLRAIADIGVTNMTSTVIATRGERLILSRVPLLEPRQEPRRSSPSTRHRRDRRRRRIAALVAFDPDDIDAAFAELDARYLAGEAAAHSRTWSLIAQDYAGDQPARTARDDAGLGKHRPPARDSFAPGDMIRIHPCQWDLSPTSTSTSRLFIG